MDEALWVEVDLATPGRTVIKSGEKRKWEGSSAFSKKKYSQNKKGDKAVVRSIVICRRCCK